MIFKSQWHGLIRWSCFLHGNMNNLKFMFSVYHILYFNNKCNMYKLRSVPIFVIYAQISFCNAIHAFSWNSCFHTREQVLKTLSCSPMERAYIVPKSYYNVLKFYKNKNRKRSVSNACGCFEMVEATGVEPVSWRPLMPASPCSDAYCCFRGCFVMRQLGKLASCLWKSRALRGNPALHQPAELSSSPLAGVGVLTRLN